MDARENPSAAYQRLARRAMRGRFAPLMLAGAPALLSGMRVMSLSARTWWLIALVIVVRLIHPVLLYGRALVFTRRFRGQDTRLGMLPRAGLLPKLWGIMALRDVPPLVLILLGDLSRARNPMNLSGQALQAAGLLLGAALSFNYCMAEYLLIDRPALSSAAALRGSRRRLMGRRFELFMLIVSFAGWALPALLVFALIYIVAYSASAATLVIAAYLLILPLSTYYHMSRVAFFESIRRPTASRRRGRQ